VKVEIISQSGVCPNGHKVGDSWIVEHVTPGGMCIAAFAAICPMLETLEFGGGLAWHADPHVLELACPDAKNPVVFRLSRLSE
jgi:uncharacterized repeat protein (TIGR04076 family)